MRKPQFALLYGVIIWALLVATSLILRVYETGDSPLFESLKFVVLASVSVAFTTQYVQKVKKVSAGEGLIVGGTWLIVVVGLDLVLYGLGLFNLQLDEYFIDVASSYFVMPLTGALIMAKLRAA